MFLLPVPEAIVLFKLSSQCLDAIATEEALGW